LTFLAKNTTKVKRLLGDSEKTCSKKASNESLSVGCRFEQMHQALTLADCCMGWNRGPRSRDLDPANSTGYPASQWRK
jgi:hypothetical protein